MMSKVASVHLTAAEVAIGAAVLHVAEAGPWVGQIVSSLHAQHMQPPSSTDSSAAAEAWIENASKWLNEAANGSQSNVGSELRALRRLWQAGVNDLLASAYELARAEKMLVRADLFSV